MKRDIGGYIELEEFKGEEYYPDLIALNSARNALVYLIKAREIRKIFLPYFLCDCVSRVCAENNCEVEYYHIGSDFSPDKELHLPPGAWLYLVNYYGQVQDNKIRAFKQKYSRLILDNVQSLFQAPIEGIDTIYTCRKYFGVPDGAYLASDARLSCSLEDDASANRMGYLLGRYEGEACDFFPAYCNAEKKYYTMPLRYMSKITHNFLRAIDYDAVKRRRESNWHMLDDAFSAMNRLTLLTPVAPFMYPLYVENGDVIRKRLGKEKIYIPTLWPHVESIASSDLERDLARHILPLPIDQRYGRCEMQRIVMEVKKCLN